MHHENGTFDLASGFSHVDAPTDFKQANGCFGGGCRALLSDEAMAREVAAA